MPVNSEYGRGTTNSDGLDRACRLFRRRLCIHLEFEIPNLKFLHQ